MRLRTTLNLASFFPIFVAALFITQLIAVHFSVVAPSGSPTEIPMTGATLMAILSLLAGWGFHRAGHKLVVQVDALEQMTERIKRGDLQPANQLPGGKGEVAAAAEVFSEMVVELRGYVQLVGAHEQLKRECDAARATAERLRESAVAVSGNLELLRRAEQGVIAWMLEGGLFLFTLLPLGTLRDLPGMLANAPGHKSAAAAIRPDILDTLRRLIGKPAAPVHGKDAPPPAPEKVSISDALADAVGLCRWKWERERPQAPLDVSVRPGNGSNCEIQGGRLGLVQAFAAVLMNAAEAMPEGGVIAIEYGTDTHGSLNVSITDTGHGMSPTVRARCLKPFFSTKEGKLGIGLTLAARLVAHCGGRVGVIGEEGKGTTVYMTFPHRPVQVAGTAAAQGQPGPLKILVVEDDAAVRATLAAMLTKDGHRVTDAEDGAAAVLWLRQERFDVVLTDRAMPIMSGDELAVVVKARYPSTPVVMVTGAGEEMERQHLQPEGVDAILPKPVLRDDLRMALARVTGHGG